MHPKAVAVSVRVKERMAIKTTGRWARVRVLAQSLEFLKTKWRVLSETHQAFPIPAPSFSEDRNSHKIHPERKQGTPAHKAPRTAGVSRDRGCDKALAPLHLLTTETHASGLHQTEVTWGGRFPCSLVITAPAQLQGHGKHKQRKVKCTAHFST